MSEAAGWGLLPMHLPATAAAADGNCCCCCCSAANFSVQELPEVMSYLRARGVKGYVALNVLVRPAGLWS